MKPRTQPSPQRRKLVQNLARRLVALERPHPLRVAIDGIDVAGKTTLADELALQVQALNRPVIRASLDGFHHPRAHRHRRGPLSPQGYYEDSFHYDALRASLPRPLGLGGDGRYRAAVFDHRSDRPADAPWPTAPAGSLLLFDGVFFCGPSFSPTGTPASSCTSPSPKPSGGHYAGTGNCSAAKPSSRSATGGATFRPNAAI